MLWKKLYRIIIVLGAIIFTAGCTCYQSNSQDTLLSGNFLDGNITLIPTINLPLTANTQVVETRNCSPDADPVLHLMLNDSQVVADDNGGEGTDARLEYLVAEPNVYQLVIRPTNNLTAGECDIFLNGSKIYRVLFGGWHVCLPNYQNGEVMQTVPQPNGVGTHSVYLLHSNGVDITNVYHSNVAGAEFAPAVQNGSLSMVLGARDISDEGTVRVINNDSSFADSDQDGLGDGLESALGTCSRSTDSFEEFDCAQVTDTRDTDGDGILDTWEVLGRTDMTPNQPLPMWGSNPLHKDIFLEVDFMHRCGSDDPNDTDLWKMTANNAINMGNYYNDKVMNLTAAEAAYRARQVENPDGINGINLHIDSGRPPEQPSHATLYGDWGGYNEVPAVTSGGTCIGGAKPADVWSVHMMKVRRGIFHYALGYVDGGGQVSEARIYSGWNMNSALNAAHEFGHSLGLGHSGPTHALPADANCKPNYPSIMNYAYYDHWYDTMDVGFSDGNRGSPLDNQSLPETNAVNNTDTWYLNHLDKIFNYNVDYSTGDVDWDRNGNISPTAVRAYANFAPGGTGCEWTRYNSIKLGDTPQTDVSPAIGRLKGFVGYRRTYVFFANTADNNLLYYTYSTSYFDCPEVDKFFCDGAKFVAPIKVETPFVETWETIDATQGVAVIKLVDRLLIVAAGEAWLRATEMTLNGSSEEFTETLRLRPLIGGEPALAGHTNFAYVAYRGLLDGRIYTMRYTKSGGWEYEQLAQWNDGGIIKDLPKMSTDASPGLAWTYLDAPAGLYGFFADENSRLRLWRWVVPLQNSDPLNLWEPVDEYWPLIDHDNSSKTPKINIGPVIKGKPAIEWVPTTGSSSWPGKLYLVYMDKNYVVRMRTTHADTMGASYQRLELDGAFNNTYAKSRGLALYYEPYYATAPTWDSALRAVLVTRSDTAAKDKRMAFHPNADGTTTLKLPGIAQGMEDINDLRVFSISLCRTLMRPTWALSGEIDPLIPTPLRCKDWDYPWFDWFD